MQKVESLVESIRIQVNGEDKQAPVDCSVAALLAWLGVAGERVAVELNRAIVRKRDWENTVVPDGAQVEIVEFVGGG
ncbi:MAG TPA: sulfur carrier protein ThiS [Bryobacteraceae bacterium]